MKLTSVVCLGLLLGFSNCQNVVIVSNNSPVIEGNDFVFVCNDTDNTGLNIGLTINGGTNLQRVTSVPESGDERTFTFRDVTRSDNMTRFTCTIGPSNPSVILVVYFAANYTRPSVTEALFCRTPLNVSFDITPGFPMSTFSLTKDSRPLSLPTDQANATGIWIPSLNDSDAGEYVFSATNAAGTTSVTLSLTVYCGPFLRAGNNDSTSIPVTEGGSFTIDCTVTQSNPPATIYRVFGSNAPMDVTSNPVRRFTSVTTSSAGVYQCIASSGQANTTFTYNVMVNQLVQSSVTPSMTLPTPSATTTMMTPTDGASKLQLGTFAIVLLLVTVATLF